MMTMLVFLAQNSGRMITREEELFAHVWKGQIVGDNAVYHQIAQLRKLFKDSANNPEYIETIPKKGYRLIAKVSILESTKAQAQIGITAVPASEQSDQRLLGLALEFI